jgi:hypothetical protein
VDHQNEVSEKGHGQWSGPAQACFGTASGSGPSAGATVGLLSATTRHSQPASLSLGSRCDMDLDNFMECLDSRCQISGTTLTTRAAITH